MTDNKYSFGSNGFASGSDENFMAPGLIVDVKYQVIQTINGAVIARIDVDGAQTSVRIHETDMR